MPYIGKHMNIIDVCETLLDLLEEELDLSNVEIPKAQNRLTRREKVRIGRRVMAKIGRFPTVAIRISPVLYGGIMSMDALYNCRS